jgi:elongation factor Tu
MAKEKFDRSKPHLNIITLGQLEHGKTTLTAAITKVLSEKGLAEQTSVVALGDTSEERERGVSFNVSRVDYETEIRHYTQIDCPNHPDYVKIMIADSNQIDGAILVVAATEEGIMSQTKEHILLAKQTGIPKIVVFLNKVELLDDAGVLELVQMDLMSELEKHGFGDSPVISGSAWSALNGDARWVAPVEQLLETLDTHLPLPVRATDKPFLMPIEDVFSITGRGTVATGRIEAGVITVNDEVLILTKNGDVRSVVTGVEMFRKLLNQGEAGDDVGLLLRGVDKDQIHRGDIMILSKNKPLHQQYAKFKSVIHILTKEEGGRFTPFFNNFRSQFFFRSLDFNGSITLPPGIEQVQPGDYLTVTVELINPTVMTKGLRFLIREGGRTIGAGQVTEVIS